MTPSQYIKSQGLPSLAYVADAVGKHRDTINNWYHTNPALFKAVVAGVKFALRKEPASEVGKCREDELLYGMSFMKDGKRISPFNIYINEEREDV